jgi:hypothetical protein
MLKSIISAFDWLLLSIFLFTGSLYSQTYPGSAGYLDTTFGNAGETPSGSANDFTFARFTN